MLAGKSRVRDDRITRAEAARVLNAPRSAVVRRVKLGKLRTYADPHGRASWLSRREVEALRDRSLRRT